MVRGAMELVIHSDLGSSALTLLRDKRFKPATLLLEAIYIAECPAPPALGVARFLPPTALRLVIDGQGQDLSDTLPHAKLRGDCLTRNRKLVGAIVRSQAERLGLMLGHAETLARDAALRLQGEAQARMRAMLGGRVGPPGSPGGGQSQRAQRGVGPPGWPGGPNRPAPGAHQPAPGRPAADRDGVVLAAGTGLLCRMGTGRQATDQGSTRRPGGQGRGHGSVHRGPSCMAAICSLNSRMRSCQ